MRQLDEDIGDTLEMFGYNTGTTPGGLQSCIMAH